ncbi:MAG: sigma 54-interacting transcriptional regulator [Polyangiaceae bacterium]|nr:sigma 54-interacting transcriptional regulator [Polyangiaceae bacterium]
MGPPRSVSADLTTAVGAAQEVAPSPLGLHPALVVRTPEATRVLDLAAGSALSIGRADDNDIVVDDTRISRKHARIEHREDGVWLVDLGSRNGSHVGSRRVDGQEALRPGDVARMGPLEILVAGASRSERAPTSASGVPGGTQPGVIIAEPSMVELFRTIRRLASLDTTVLITGETGSGKEVVAQELHSIGHRAKGPFVSVNAAAVPETLLEATLFGHERGAFTGADKKRPGVFQRAHGGTLFLDEIAEMPPTVQAKLLRVLETRKVQPLGASEEIELDVRIIAATHRDLRAEVRAGRFREDLLFRIGAFILAVPPLRERPAEIALLASEFASRLASKHGLERVTILPATFDALRSRAWPGNVRELKNAIEHAMVLAEDGVIRPEHLPSAEGPLSMPPPSMPPSSMQAPPSVPPPGAVGFRDQMAEAERRAIEAALRDNAGNQSATARQLGISRRALLYKMERYGIKVRRELG